MATSTSNTFLMYNNGSAMVKLIDIKDFPDMGGEPEKIDTTTLYLTRQKHQYPAYRMLIHISLPRIIAKTTTTPLKNLRETRKVSPCTLALTEQMGYARLAVRFPYGLQVVA